MYCRGTGHSHRIIVDALDKQLGIRYPGMRGTVQYEREMGGWVGQLWWSKQRGWWWLGLHHQASRRIDAVGRTIVVVELGLGLVVIVVLVVGPLSLSYQWRGWLSSSY